MLQFHHKTLIILIITIICISTICSSKLPLTHKEITSEIRQETQNVKDNNATNYKMEANINNSSYGWIQSLVNNDDTFVGRTFGGIRRLKIAIPAIMYKLGVVTTMLGVLTLLTAKGVLIGLIILIIQLSAGLSKLHTSKQEPTWENEKPPQNIHVHVHGTGTHSGHYTYSHPPSHSSSFWDRKTEATKSNLNLSPSNSNLNLYASLTPYSAYNTNKYSKLDDDLINKLKEYKELKALTDLRDSLYQQVI